MHFLLTVRKLFWRKSKKSKKSKKLSPYPSSTHVHVFSTSMEGLTEFQIVTPSKGFSLLVVCSNSQSRDQAFNTLNGAKLYIDIGKLRLQASKPASAGKSSKTSNVLRFSKTSYALPDILEQWFNSRGTVPTSSIQVEESTREL